MIEERVHRMRRLRKVNYEVKESRRKGIRRTNQKSYYLSEALGGSVSLGVGFCLD